MLAFRNYAVETGLCRAVAGTGLACADTGDEHPVSAESSGVEDVVATAFSADTQSPAGPVRVDDIAQSATGTYFEKYSNTRRYERSDCGHLASERRGACLQLRLRAGVSA